MFETQKNQGYSRSTYAEKSFKWENRYWLIVIAVACLALCFLGSRLLEVSLVQKAVKLLPVIGSACFAVEAVVKLI